MKLSGCILAIFLLVALAPAPSRGQTKSAPAAPPMPPPDAATKYDRSPSGLLLQLQMILSNTKDPEKTKALVDALILPKYDDYFQKVYQKDVELFWAGSYTHALLSAQGDFRSLFVRLSMEQGKGEFNIRRINDMPASHFEEVLTAKMNGPVEIYAVSWKKRNAPANMPEDLMGYYAYLGNRFRWFYMNGFPKSSDADEKTNTKPKGGTL
jgi:hypothetical protein